MIVGDDSSCLSFVFQISSPRLVESEWQSTDRNGPKVLSKSDFLTILSNIERILIRANVHSEDQLAHVSDVALDTAVQQQTGQESVEDIEVCRCPEGYSGTSCEVSLLLKPRFEFVDNLKLSLLSVMRSLPLPRHPRPISRPIGNMQTLPM